MTEETASITKARELGKNVAYNIGKMELEHPAHLEVNWHFWLEYFNIVDTAIFSARSSMQDAMLEQLNSKDS